MLILKSKVKNPGSRGGRGYWDEQGEWQYGERPAAETPTVFADFLEHKMPVKDGKPEVLPKDFKLLSDREYKRLPAGSEERERYKDYAPVYMQGKYDKMKPKATLADEDWADLQRFAGIPRRAQPSARRLWELSFGSTSLNEVLKNLLTPPYLRLSDLRVTYTNRYDGRLGYEFSAELKNPRGADVGSVIRQVWLNPDGSMTFEHEFFVLRGDAKQQGIGTEFNEQAEAFYRKVTKHRKSNIVLNAGCTVGKYAWARMGFDFQDEDELEHAKMSFLRTAMTYKNSPDNRQKIVELVEGVKHAWELAAIDDGNLYDYYVPGSELTAKGHMGKAAIMHVDFGNWYGVKWLDPTSEGQQIAGLYRGLKKKKMRKSQYLLVLNMRRRGAMHDAR